MPRRRRQHAPLEKAPEADKATRLKAEHKGQHSQGSYSTLGLTRKLARMVNLQRTVGNQAVQRVLADDGAAGVAQIERMLVSRAALQTDQAETETTETQTDGERDLYETQLDNSFSGAHWETKFPAKTSMGELDSGFTNRLSGFLSALRKAGAAVNVKSTLWPPERVYLMHWAYRIARQGFDPQQVPMLDKVDIRWWHGTPELSRKAAEAMLKAFKIDKYEKAPPLKTHHSDGNALDMEIGWGGALMIEDANGQMHTIKDSPHDGTNPALIAVAATFGVIGGEKHDTTTPPHWSTDGN